MTTNTMMTKDTMTNTNNAVRITKAVIGFGLLLPVISGAASSSLVFALSLAGCCLIFTSMVSKNSAFGCLAALAILGFMALTSTSVAPATIAVMSFASIAIVAAGLIGAQLPVAAKNSPRAKMINAHISNVSGAGNAANDNRRLAA